MLNLLEAFCQISNSLEKRQLAVGAQLITVKLNRKIMPPNSKEIIMVMMMTSRSSSSSKFDNREIVILKGLTQLTNELLDACLCLVLTDK
ncbi:hypothetical protein T4B_5846 [Trichinella pseudospiralis]|uniref:Uncharacterized protein n=1 Tax=Trichinella pseudospiralis TaxID=6337 RepID=A0A0V1IHU5_TRIPS|nr:hypothetical protein T4B_5846 [Trichinella pseudospiralis]